MNLVGKICKAGMSVDYCFDMAILFLFRLTPTPLYFDICKMTPIIINILDSLNPVIQLEAFRENIKKQITDNFNLLTGVVEKLNSGEIEKMNYGTTECNIIISRIHHFCRIFKIAFPSYYEKYGGDKMGEIREKTIKMFAHINKIIPIKSAQIFAIVSMAFVYDIKQANLAFNNYIEHIYQTYSEIVMTKYIPKFERFPSSEENKGLSCCLYFGENTEVEIAEEEVYKLFPKLIKTRYVSDNRVYFNLSKYPVSIYYLMFCKINPATYNMTYAQMFFLFREFINDCGSKVSFILDVPTKTETNQNCCSDVISDVVCSDSVCGNITLINNDYEITQLINDFKEINTPEIGTTNYFDINELLNDSGKDINNIINGLE